MTVWSIPLANAHVGSPNSFLAISVVCWLISTIRKGMVSMMLSMSSLNSQPKKRRPAHESRGHVSQHQSGNGDSPVALSEDSSNCSNTSGGDNTQEDAGAQVATNASICMLWSAIALGGLVQGRSVASVSCETMLSIFAPAVVVFSFQLLAYVDPS